MKVKRIAAGHYEVVTPSGTRLVISQVASAYNQYGQRRKNTRAGNPWRVRVTSIEGPASVIAEEWTLTAAKDAAALYAAQETP